MPVALDDIREDAAQRNLARSAIHHDLNFERGRAGFREGCAVRGYAIANGVRRAGQLLRQPVQVIHGIRAQQNGSPDIRLLVDENLVKEPVMTMAALGFAQQ